MMNWKFSKIQIQGFKAFPNAIFDFSATNLITLDGPNGYGKTTVFDAIELLLTGKISRLKTLFEKVMPKQQKNYTDNLYWNTKHKGDSLFIKAELLNIATKETRAFARFANIEQLSDQKSNCADKFDIFKLCSLDSFDSTDFSKLENDNYVDDLFGKSFSANYSMLNYLHQGETAFIFNSSIKDRKDALEGLMDSKETVDRINFLAKAEKMFNAPLKQIENQIAELNQSIQQLSSTSESGISFEFKALGTQIPPAAWDSENPFPTFDSEKYQRIQQSIQTLISASQVHDEIKIRLENKKIEKYIHEKDNDITLTIKIGKHLDVYDSLRAENLKIQRLRETTHKLRAAKDISRADITFAMDKEVIFGIDILAKIAMRDNLSKAAGDANVAISTLLSAREALVVAYKKTQSEHSALCPLCGHDWREQAQLLEAIEIATESLKNKLSTLGEQLKQTIDEIEACVAPIIPTSDKISNNTILNIGGEHGTKSGWGRTVGSGETTAEDR